METDALTPAELTDLGYSLVTSVLQPRLKNDGVKDGAALWTTCPTDHVAGMRVGEKTIGVSMRYTVDSSAELASATFMLTKSMMYALYAGCLDLFKRTPGWHDRTIRAGEEHTASATVGDVTMTMTMRVIHIEGVS